MRLLLDTHILLWALQQPARLNQATRDVLEDSANIVFFSAASIWEIAVKARLGRANFTFDPKQVAQIARRTGFEELAITAADAACVADLPLYHRDPFDRLLIAQAINGPLRLYTADPLLPPYSDLVEFQATTAPVQARF